MREPEQTPSDPSAGQLPAETRTPFRELIRQIWAAMLVALLAIVEKIEDRPRVEHYRAALAAVSELVDSL